MYFTHYLYDHYFVQCGFIQVYIFSRNFLGKLLFCLSGLPALCQIRCNFHKLCNICLIVVYIVGVRYSVFLLSIMSKKRYYTINIWVHFLINKHVSMELLRFSILQIPFIKKNVKHSQTVWVKKAINKQIVLRTCKKYKLYFGPLVLAAL